MPMRLWSTVASQLVTRPSFQVGIAAGSALTAPLGSSRERVVRLDVGDQRVDLPVVPTSSDGRHVAGIRVQVLAVLEELAKPLPVRERAVSGDRGADAALAVEPVALRAGGA